MKKIILAIFCLLIGFKLSAQQTTLSLTGVTTGSAFYYCQTTTTSVIVYKPTGAGIGSWSTQGIPPFVADSIIITTSIQGLWNFNDGIMAPVWFLRWRSTRRSC